MKVLSTGMEWFTEAPGGLARYFADFLSAWDKAGYDARAIVRSASSDRDNSIPSYVRTVNDNGGSRHSYQRLWKHAMQDELVSFQPDVFNPHFAYYAQSWSRLQSDLPVVTNFHGPWAYESMSNQTGSMALRDFLHFRLKKAMELRLYRHSDHFITLSEAFKEQLSSNYSVPRSNIHVIPGAVDVDHFCDSDDQEAVRASLHLPENKMILVTVRRLVQRMGIDRLLDTMLELKREFPQIFLCMIGDGPLRCDLEVQVRRLGLENYVRITGRVSDDELVRYYQAADFSVVPSVALEGFGLATVESMACGTPVIGTPTGGTKEILQHYDPQLLLKSSSVEDMVNGISGILSDVKRLPTREYTRSHAIDYYSWPSVIDRVHEVFELAIGNKNGRK